MCAFVAVNTSVTFQLSFCDLWFCSRSFKIHSYITHKFVSHILFPFDFLHILLCYSFDV